MEKQGLSGISLRFLTVGVVAGMLLLILMAWKVPEGEVVDTVLESSQASIETPALQGEQENPRDNAGNDRDPVLDRNALENLAHHPACKSVFVAEYIPIANKAALEHCEKILVREQDRQLKHEYIEQICSNPARFVYPRGKVARVQAYLQSYASMFPQTSIRVSHKDIDGIYGPVTCEAIANYQYETRQDLVNGIIDENLYTSLASEFSLDPEQKEIIALVYRSKPAPDRISRWAAVDFHPDEYSLDYPENPLKQIFFCAMHSTHKACVTSREQFLVETSEYK